MHSTSIRVAEHGERMANVRGTIGTWPPKDRITCTSRVLMIKILTELFSGSDRCPGGLGGSLSRGSSFSSLPLPYSGITLSRLIPALHTGHACRLGLVSNH